MTKSLKEHQIVQILEEAKMGALSIDDLCRKHGISRSTFYKWKDKYGGFVKAPIFSPIQSGQFVPNCCSY